MNKEILYCLSIVAGGNYFFMWPFSFFTIKMSLETLLYLDSIHRILCNLSSRVNSLLNSQSYLGLN